MNLLTPIIKEETQHTHDNTQYASSAMQTHIKENRIGTIYRISFFYSVLWHISDRNTVLERIHEVAERFHWVMQSKLWQNLNMDKDMK